MRFFVLLLTLSGIYSLPLLALPPFSLPPDDEHQQTRSQGSRGCPDSLGELILLSGKELKTQQPNPIILFWLQTEQPQSILLVINETDIRQSQPVFEQKLVAQGKGYLPVKIQGNLVLGKSYRLTAGILCRDRPERASALTAQLIRVDRPTAFDQMVISYYHARTPQKIEPIKVD